MVIAETEVSLMEKILKNPGLVPLAEYIFNNLSDEAVEICQLILKVAQMCTMAYLQYYLAANFGFIEFVKILSPFADNPNSPDGDWKTPICLAAYIGIREIFE